MRSKGEGKACLAAAGEGKHGLLLVLVVTEEAAAGSFVSREGEGIERRGEGREGMGVTARLFNIYGPFGLW